MIKNKFLLYFFFSLLSFFPLRGDFFSIISSKNILIGAKILIGLGMGNALKNYFLCDKKLEALFSITYVQKDLYKKWISMRIFNRLWILSKEEKECKKALEFMHFDKKFMNYNHLPDYKKIMANINIITDLINNINITSPKKIENFLFGEVAADRKSNNILYFRYNEDQELINLNINLSDEEIKKCYVQSFLLFLLNNECILCSKNNVLQDLYYIVSTLGNVLQGAGFIAFILLIIVYLKEKLV